MRFLLDCHSWPRKTSPVDVRRGCLVQRLTLRHSGFHTLGWCCRRPRSCLKLAVGALASQAIDVVVVVSAGAVALVLVAAAGTEDVAVVAPAGTSFDASVAPEFAFAVAAADSYDGSVEVGDNDCLGDDLDDCVAIRWWLENSSSCPPKHLATEVME